MGWRSVVVLTVAGEDYGKSLRTEFKDYAKKFGQIKPCESYRDK